MSNLKEVIQLSFMLLTIIPISITFSIERSPQLQNESKYQLNVPSYEVVQERSRIECQPMCGNNLDEDFKNTNITQVKMSQASFFLQKKNTIKDRVKSRDDIDKMPQFNLKQDYTNQDQYLSYDQCNNQSKQDYLDQFNAYYSNGYNSQNQQNQREQSFKYSPHKDNTHFLSTGVVLIDDSKKIIQCNKSFKEMLSSICLNQAYHSSSNSHYNSEIQSILEIQLKYTISEHKVSKQSVNDKQHNPQAKNNQPQKYQNQEYKEQSIQQEQFINKEDCNIQDNSKNTFYSKNNSLNNSNQMNLNNFDISFCQKQVFQKDPSNKDDMRQQGSIYSNLVKKFNQPEDVFQRSQQCNISGIIDSFFEQEKNNLDLEDLLEFILDRNPEIIQENYYNLLEPYNLSPSNNIQNLLNNDKCTTQKKIDNQIDYQYTIENNYLVITILRPIADNQNSSNYQNYSSQNYQNYSSQNYQNYSSQNYTNKNVHYHNNKQIMELKIGCFCLDDSKENQIKKNKNSFYNIYEQAYSKRVSNKSNKDQPQPNTKDYKRQLSQNRMNNLQPSKDQNLKEQNKEEDQEINEDCDIKVEINNNMIQQNRQNKRYFLTIELYCVTSNLKSIFQREIQQFKQATLSSFSRELRTPLCCITNMLDLMNARDEIPELIKSIYINPILFSSYILLSIADDIQDTSEFIQQGKVSMTFSEFSPQNTCLECLNFIKLQAQQKHLELEFVCEQSVPQLISSDLSKTRQVLLNLLSNCLKFTQKGSISLRLSSPSEKVVQIDVKDTGCGIPPKELKQYFQSFYEKQQQFKGQQRKQKMYSCSKSQQEQKQREDKILRSGLNISYHLSVYLGENRKLSAVSEVGKGSIFTFYLINKRRKITPCSLQYEKENNKSMSRMWIDLDTDHLSNQIDSHNHQQQNDDNGDDQLEKRDIQLNQEQLQQENKDIIIDLIVENSNHNDLNKKQSKQQITQSDNCFKYIPVEKEQQPYHERETLFSQNALKKIHHFQIKQNQLSHLTLNLINQTSVIYQALQSFLLPEDISISIKNKISSKELTYFKSKKDTYRTKSEKLRNKQTKLNSKYKKENDQIRRFATENTIEDKSDYYYSVKNCTDKLFKNLQPDLDFDSLINELNVPSNNFRVDNESCNIANDSVKRYHPKTFITSSIFKSLKIKEDTISNLDIPSPQLSDKKIKINKKKKKKKKKKKELGEQTIEIVGDESMLKYRQSEQMPSENKQPSGIHNANQNNTLNKISQIILKSDTSISYTESSPQDQQQQSQILYFNLSHAIFTSSEDVKKQLKQMNYSKKCKCAEILIVDDNEFNLVSLEIRLKSYLFILDKANNGIQALQFVKDKSKSACCKNYSLIFMDLNMPFKDGYETTRDLINLYSTLHLKVPPISAWTVYNQEIEKEKAMAAGMTYYLTKPINLSAFENILFQQFIKCNDSIY